MFKQICIWIYLVCLLLAPGVEASDIELKNLKWDWEVFDQKSQHYVPYFKKPTTDALRFKVDLNKYRNSYLKLSVPEKHSIWIQDELIYVSSRPVTKYLSLDSLQDIYRMGSFYLSVYSDNLNGNTITSVLVNKEDDNLSLREESSFSSRKSNNWQDIFIIISIATMSLIAIFRAFYFRLFQEYLSIGKSLQLRQNFELAVAHAPLAWPNIGFIIFYSILIGSSVMICDLFLPNSSLIFPFSIKNEGGIYLGLKISIYCFVFMIAKLLLITAGTELFKLKKVKLIHFFTYFRLSLIFALFCFSLSILDGVFGGYLVSTWWNWIQLIVVLFWSGRLVLIYFVLNKIYTFRKLHLFSYLCSSELIPLLVFFKIFLK